MAEQSHHTASRKKVETNYGNRLGKMVTITDCTCLKDKRIILPHFPALILKLLQKKKIKYKEKNLECVKEQQS